jgi:colicin import membrane protein
MKTKNLFLVLLVLITFGSTEIFGQTVEPASSSQTSRSKRKYTKKPKAAADNAISATTDATAKPKRKYTKKVKEATDNPVSTMTDATAKPKRTYTKKTQTTNVTSAPAVADNTVSTPKVKRSYTRKVPVNNPTSPAVVQNNYPQSKTVAQAKTPYTPKSAGVEKNHQILVGPRGGKYYINKNGNKTYVK